eukprot:6178200-Pleurochrysis_carterae.AAC.3
MGEDRDRMSLPRPGQGETREQRGRWVVRRLQLGRAAGAAGKRRQPLAVLEVRGLAQQPGLRLGQVEAERRRARWEQHTPRTHRADRGAADHQPDFSGGDERRWPAARAARWGSVRAEAAAAAAGLRARVAQSRRSSSGSWDDRSEHGRRRQRGVGSRS